MLILTDKDRDDLLILRQKLKSGELSPESPCEGANVPWTDEQKARLKDALAGVFGWGESTFHP